MRTFTDRNPLNNGLIGNDDTGGPLEVMRSALQTALIINLKKKMDYTEYGGAILLGVNGCVIKAHGSSNAKAIKSAVNQAREFIAGDTVNIIKEEITKIED